LYSIFISVHHKNSFNLLYNIDDIAAGKMLAKIYCNLKLPV